MKSNIIKVSDAELEILKALWHMKQGTSSQVVEYLSGKTDWKPKTIQTLITRLTKKEILTVNKDSKKSYVYSPSISEDEYRKFANNSLLNKLYNGSVNSMLSTFIKNTSLSNEDIQSLKNLLDNEF